MEWIPFQRLVIKTDITKEEVVTRMRELVGPKKYENFVRVDKNIFSGQLIDDRFYLTLNKEDRNSWTPEITGTITERNDKVELLVTLNSNWFVIAFTTIIIIIGLSLFVSELIDYKETGDINWITLAFVLFPYGLCWFSFNVDAEKAIDGLLKITKGVVK